MQSENLIPVRLSDIQCPIEFKGMTCEEFIESVQRPDAPQWMRDFAGIFCEGGDLAIDNDVDLI